MCFNKSYLWKLTFLFIICYWFENNFCARKSSKVFKVFKRFHLISWHENSNTVKITTKMRGKINLYTKVTLKGKSKRHLYSYKTLKNSIKIWKKLNFLSGIPNLSHIYQLSLTHFGHFKVYFCSIFHFY